jgi:peptidase E
MTGQQRQVIALGGGGFSMEPDNPALDLYVLQQARTAQPSVTFLCTARGDADSYVLRFYQAFSRYPCRPSHLPFFQRTPNVRDWLLRQDIIYVGGGNTRSMLAVWRAWDLPALLQEAWQEGTLLAGISAGAICWFEQGVTDSWAEKLAVLPCLGFLKGSCCPHYDGEPERRPAYHDFLLKGEILPGVAIDDGAAIHFVEGEIHRTVASRPHARAYRLRAGEGAVQEVPLETEYLRSSASEGGNERKGRSDGSQEARQAPAHP